MVCSSIPVLLWSRTTKNTDKIVIESFILPQIRESMSERASGWVSTAERVSNASRAEKANEWAVQANKRVAQYLRHNYCLFQTTVQRCWEAALSSSKSSDVMVEKWRYHWEVLRSGIIIQKQFSKCREAAPPRGHCHWEAALSRSGVVIVVNGWCLRYWRESVQ